MQELPKKGLTNTEINEVIGKNSTKQRVKYIFLSVFGYGEVGWKDYYKLAQVLYLD
jgi:hypothetical protein